MRIKAIGVGSNPEVASEAVTVEHLPPCDYHFEQSDELVSANFAGFTIFETHAFMCASCFNLYGMGLGPGKGQRLVIGA